MQPLTTHWFSTQRELNLSCLPSTSPKDIWALRQDFQLPVKKQGVPLPTLLKLTAWRWKVALPPPSSPPAQPLAAPGRGAPAAPISAPHFSRPPQILCHHWAHAPTGCSVEALLFAPETASEEGVSISNYTEWFTRGSHTCLLGQAQGTEVMGEVCVLSSHFRMDKAKILITFAPG